MAIIKGLTQPDSASEDGTVSSSPTKKVSSSTRSGSAILRGASVSSSQRIMINKIKTVRSVSKIAPTLHLDQPSTEHHATDTIDNTESKQAPSDVASYSVAAAQPSIDYAAVDAEINAYRSEAKTKVDQELQEFRDTRLTTIHDECAELKESAYNDGYDEGKTAAETELAGQSKDLLAAINSLAQEKNRLMNEAEPAILKLAVEISEQVINGELSINQTVSKNIVDEALRRVTDKNKVIIRMNPNDAEWIRSQTDWLQSYMQDIKHLSIQDDVQIKSGGCIIETQLGYIDSSIKTKLASIEKALLLVYEDERGDVTPSSIQEERPEDDDIDMEESAENNLAAEADEGLLPPPPPPQEEPISEDAAFEDMTGIAEQVSSDEHFADSDSDIDDLEFDL